MARVKRAVNGKKHRRAVLESAQGYYGNRSRTFRSANEAVMHSLQYAYRDRRARKGDFRRLWIQRINAAARANGTSYSRLIAGLREAEVVVDRKVLADLAVTDPEAFTRLVGVADVGPGRRVRRPRWRRRPGTAPDHGARLSAPAGPAPAPAAGAAQRPAVRGGIRGRGGQASRSARSTRARRWRRSSSTTEARAQPRRWRRSLDTAREPGGPGLRPGPGCARAGGRHRDPPARPGRGGACPTATLDELAGCHLRGGVRRRA